MATNELYGTTTYDDVLNDIHDAEERYGYGTAFNCSTISPEEVSLDKALANLGWVTEFRGELSRGSIEVVLYNELNRLIVMSMLAVGDEGLEGEDYLFRRNQVLQMSLLLNPHYDSQHRYWGRRLYERVSANRDLNVQLMRPNYPVRMAKRLGLVAFLEFSPASDRDVNVQEESRLAEAKRSMLEGEINYDSSEDDIARLMELECRHLFLKAMIIPSLKGYEYERNNLVYMYNLLNTSGGIRTYCLLQSLRFEHDAYRIEDEDQERARFLRERARVFASLINRHGTGAVN